MNEFIIQHPLLSNFILIIETICWVGAYFLIVRLAFKEKTYGMPIVAMCGNIAWEFLYGMGILDPCSVTSTSCNRLLSQGTELAAFSVDCLILYTILRFGRKQFSQPYMQKYFPYIVLMGVGVAITVIYVLDSYLYVANNGIANQPDFLKIGQFNGLFTGFGQALMMALLFPAMLASRNSLEGQSFLIALGMAIGNVCAGVGIYYSVPSETLIVLSIIFNFVYVALVYQKSKELGVSLWKH